MQFVNSLPDVPIIDWSPFIWPASVVGVVVLVALLLIAWSRPGWILVPLRRRPRNVLAWILALLIVAGYVVNAWWIQGQNTCDFGNQWLMGRMIYLVEGRNLYFVGPQCEALATGYAGIELQRMENEVLFKGYDPITSIEGPLYPPTHALLMYPWSILEPRASHAVLVLIYAQLVFVAAWAVNVITQKRLQIGEAALGIALFPNIAGAFILAQNSMLSLAIVAVGWALCVRRRPWLAGLTWGLLAFKPVFGLTLVLAPLVFLNWRMILGMAVGSGLFAGATLPFCGIGSWQRWLMVGQNAADIYARDRNWVWMSRDLIGLPRRVLWDPTSFWEHVKMVAQLRGPDQPALPQVDKSLTASVVGVCLVAAVVLTTLLIGWHLARHGRRTPLGDRWLNDPLAAFALLGSLLTVYHFMHYDLLPMSVPVLILLSNADRLRWRHRAWLMFLWVVLLYCLIDLNHGVGSMRIPFETFLMLATWAWAGWLAWRDRYPWLGAL